MDGTQYRSRFLILLLLFTVPFLRMLMEHRYGFLYVEVFVAILIIAAFAAALAAIARTRNAFRVLVVGSVVVLSVNALQVNFLPDVRARWVIAGLVTFLVAGILLLRTHFYRIVLIFVVGSGLGDIANAVAEYAGTRTVAQSSEKRKYEHVVHIILDEMAGLAAVPQDCTACVQAANSLQRSLEESNFRIYPYAFSNYQGTRDSIPSILNGRLLARTEEYLPDGEYTARPFLRKNGYFNAFLAKKYAIRTYQSDFLLFDSPEYPVVRSRTYKATSLKALHALNGPWWIRLKQLLAIYIESDRFWWAIETRFIPSKLQVERIEVGPIAAQQVWPQQVLEDYRAATQNTLFLVHLLIPHRPYVYRADGSKRDLQDVASQSSLWVYDAEKYQALYRQYGEQVQFLAGELDAFLKELKKTDSFDSTTVIIHGDHGSRIRLLKSEQRPELERLRKETVGINPLSRYDYLGKPDVHDLLNRFGTLLAIKPPESRRPQVVNETGSVLYFLERFFGAWGEPVNPQSMNAAYLFNADGSPYRIPVGEIVRDYMAETYEPSR